MDFRVKLNVLSITLIWNCISCGIFCENIHPKYEVSALFEYLPLPGSTIKLEDHRDYFAVVDLAASTRTDYSEIYFQLGREQLDSESDVKITIEAPKGHGIMAVIQTIDFGVGSILFPEREPCPNYIEFSEEGSFEHKTGKICGTFAKGHLQPQPKGLIGPRTYTSFSDKIIVKFSKAIFFSRRKNKLEIAFTAYKNFNLKSPNATSEMQSEGYESCFSVDISKLTGKSIIPAIKRNLTCDSVVNCGGQTAESFATDESRISCLMARNVIHVIESVNSESSAMSDKDINHRKKTDATSFTTFIIVIMIFILFYGLPATCFIYHNAKLPAVLQHAAPTTFDDGDFSDDSEENRTHQYDSQPPAYEMPPAYEHLFPVPSSVSIPTSTAN